MPKVIFYDGDVPRERVYVNNHNHTHIHRKPYGCLSFVGDCLATLFTGGLWLIWVFVREMRGRR